MSNCLLAFYGGDHIPGIVFQCVDQKLMNIDTRGISVFLTGIWERFGGEKKRGDMTDRLKMNPKASETPTRVGKSRVSLLLLDM